MLMFYGAYNLKCVTSLCALCLAVCGEERPLDEVFRDPSADTFRPSVAMDLEHVSRDPGTLAQQVSQVREMGAGGLLLRMPVADDEVWKHLALVSDTCRRLGLELGIRDVTLSSLEGRAPRVQRLVWSMTRTRSSGAMTNEWPSVFHPGGGYRELVRLAVAADGEVLPHQVVDVGVMSVPSNGLWRLYHFGCSDVDPPKYDCFDGAGVSRHVNQLLITCQSRLERTYGTTLLWCQMAGPGNKDWLWPRDLPEQFSRQSGLDLMRYVPALAGVAVGGEATAAYVRQQVAQTVREIWRNRYAEKVNELVHEAGLEAGMDVDEVPIDPEEVAVYFRRPTLSPARTHIQHEKNVRASGGARTLGRRYVIGEVDGDQVTPTPAQVLLPFPGKHEVDRLLGEGVTRMLFAVEGKVPEAGERFAQMRAACRYAHRCQILLQRGEPVADFLVWSTGLPHALEGYACDFANPNMLAAATVKGGAIRFESERTYTAFAVTAERVRDKTAERRVRQMAEGGVGVWLVACGLPGEDALFARLSEDGKCKVMDAAGETGPVRDCQWETEIEGLQLRFLHRRLPEGELYFVVNASAVGGPVTCTFRDVGQGRPERWDPVTGETGLGLPSTRTTDGRISVPLFLVPHDACFVVFPH